MKILVIGETCDDIFIYGEVSRLNPEAPVPIIIPKYQIVNKGMAENVANNLKSLGSHVDLICNQSLIKKIRYVDDSYNYILLRIDEGDICDRIDLNNLPNDDYSAVVVGDYNKGFLSEDDIKFISKKYSCPTFLDTKKELGDWVRDINYIKINNSEYQRNKDVIDSHLLNKTIITRGKVGCDFNGKNLVLYFYPKDSTPGCTTEGQNFRDLYEEFQANNTEIIGVSRESIKSHENFKEKQSFPFELLSDPDEKVCKAYDVMKLKSMYGREYIGVDRSTFIIDANSKLVKEWRGVKVKGHADEVLDFIQNLD